ncbi:uncharacterized protein [Watersipora subatra]|uniref:uncharacterized protein n=1 Tax=Watersipora subatra TaxID=2589382 RepID=UPI00355B275A
MKFFTAIVSLACISASMAAMDVKGSFGLMDTDMNGWSSKSEFTNLLMSFDDNANGKVDTLEFINHFSVTGLSAEGSVYVFYFIDQDSDLLLDTTEISNFFTSIDFDGDENLSYNEYASQMYSVLSQLQIAGAAKVRLDKLFDNADVKKDGNLTSVEFWSLLTAADTDGSGLISEAEFVTYWRNKTLDTEDRAKRMFGKLSFEGGELGSDTEKSILFNAFDYGNNSLVSKEEFEFSMLDLFKRVMVDVNEQLVSEFYSPNLDRNALFSSIDIDSSSMISANEFTQHRSSSDTNGDGMFSLNEFVAYLMSQGYNLRPALYQFFFLDSNSDGKLDSSELAWSFSNEDQNGDGQVDMDEFNRAINYLEDDILVAARASPLIESLLSASDVDGDNYYTADELRSIFAAADQDGDGNIPKDDFVAFWSQHTGLDKLVSTQLFSAIDGDKNGISSFDERLAAFAQFDSDRSGTISADEFSSGLLLIYARIMQGKLIQTYLTLQGSFNVTRSFYDTDVNKDNVLTTADTNILFHALDKNADNLISAGEFIDAYNNSGLHPTGALYLFYRLLTNRFDFTLNQTAFDKTITDLDSNGDDSVTLQEFTAKWALILRELAEASFTGSRTALLFNKYDTDKTGNLTFGEFSNIFNMADTNEDGVVSQEEFKKNWMRATLEPADRTVFLFNDIDQDKDGVFGDEQEKQTLFDAMDYGNNDLVSYDEFQNSLLNIFAVFEKSEGLRKKADAVIGFF